MINEKVNNNNLIILSLLIVLNLFTGRFFENIIILNIPINFYILFFLFINSKLHSKIFSYSDPILKIFFIYLLFSFIQLIIGFTKNGIWALRDGLYFLNMFFFFIGYHYSNNLNSINGFDRFLKIIAIITFFYVLLLSLGLKSWGPTITSPQGNQYSLINFFNLRHIFIWVGFYLLIYKNKNLFINKLFPILLLGLSIATFQSRTSYLTIFFILIYFIYLNKISLKDIIKLSFLLVFVYLIYNLIGINPGVNLVGRLTTEFSIKYFFNHISTLFVFFEDYQFGLLSGPESSALARYGWWTEVIEKNSKNLLYMLFGQGFGIPLIDFQSSSTGFAREPHNMLITVYGRQGLIGLILFSLLIIKSITRIHKFVNSNHIKDGDRQIFLSFLVYILIITIGFIGDSILNYSSASLIYFVFIGYILGYEFKVSR
jgi:hypothetical protein